MMLTMPNGQKIRSTSQMTTLAMKMKKIPKRNHISAKKAQEEAI